MDKKSRLYKKLQLSTSRVKLALAVLTAVILMSFITVFIMLMNPPWVHTPLLQNSQAALSRMILTYRDVVKVDDRANGANNIVLTPAKFAAVKEGNLTIITASDIRHGQLHAVKNNKQSFVIATIDPADIEDLSLKEKQVAIEAVDALALSGKIDAIVESSASDLARANDWGLRQAKLLNKAGVIRCVLFDGGHHVETLPLAPGVLLVPVTNYKGQAYASHWFTRDSVSLSKLQDLLKREQIGSAIAQFPRNGVPVKNSPGMALLAAQAISKLAKTHSNAGPVKQAKTATRHNSPAFISLTIKGAQKEGSILQKIELEARKRAANKNPALKTTAKRVYIGITFGNSQFPYQSTNIGLTGSEIEAELNARLPQDIVVLSEPLSTWDIYRQLVSGENR